MSKTTRPKDLEEREDENKERKLKLTRLDQELKSGLRFPTLVSLCRVGSSEVTG